MAMGEKPTIALISAAASARMAVVESLMNLGAADIKSGTMDGDLKRVKLSANWMSAVSHPGEGVELYGTLLECFNPRLLCQLGSIGCIINILTAATNDPQFEERSLTRVDR